jgi:hypothetical protein
VIRRTVVLLSEDADLPGIAILGIVILHSYSRELDRRLAPLSISPEARSSIDEQRARLGATELPAGVNDEMRIALRKAIDVSFVFGFRMVMTTAVGLALASALSAFMMIEGKVARSAVGAFRHQ